MRKTTIVSLLLGLALAGTAYQTKDHAPFDEYHTHSALRAQSPVESANSC